MAHHDMGMMYKPHGYQQRAQRFIADTPRCALWLEMGLGKTASTLAALREMLALGEVEPPVLIVAPLRVARHTWPEELKKWTQFRELSCCVLAGKSAKTRAAALKRLDCDLYTIGYDLLPWLVKHLGSEWPFRVVVLDEASRVKNPDSKRFKALRWVQGYIERLIELTGTPAPNGLLDLWAPLYLLDGGERLEKTQGAFKQRYFMKVGTDPVTAQWKPYEKSQERIEDKVRDIVISMRSQDYLDLPPFIVNKVLVDLPPEARTKYDILERDMVVQIRAALVEAEATHHTVTALTAASLTAKCHQFAMGGAYVLDANGEPTGQWEEIHDEKYQALDDIIEDANGQPVLVVYWFRFDIERLKRRYPHVQFLDKRGKVIDAWNRGEVQLLAVNPASAGHGLNLQQGGCILVHLTPQWSLELDEQVNARLFRQGQTRPVIAHYIIARNTVEEDILVRLQSKASVQDALKARLKI